MKVKKAVSEGRTMAMAVYWTTVIRGDNNKHTQQLCLSMPMYTEKALQSYPGRLLNNNTVVLSCELVTKSQRILLSYWAGTRPTCGRSIC